MFGGSCFAGEATASTVSGTGAFDPQPPMSRRRHSRPMQRPRPKRRRRAARARKRRREAAIIAMSRATVPLMYLCLPLLTHAFVCGVGAPSGVARALLRARPATRSGAHGAQRHLRTHAADWPLRKS